jgi:DNA polymerase phi
MGLIMDNTKHQGSMKGQEERDILFARLFGISSIIQSGLAVRTTPLPSLATSETPASSPECYEQIISSLLSLGDQKSWLRESAWFTINLAVDALYGSDVSWKEKAVDKTLDALFTTHSVWSTEKLALTLKLQDSFPSRDWKSYLSPIFKNTNILSTGNLATVAKILKVGQLSTLLVLHIHGYRNQRLTKTERKTLQRHQVGVGGLN